MEVSKCESSVTPEDRQSISVIQVEGTDVLLRCSPVVLGSEVQVRDKNLASPERSTLR